METFKQLVNTDTPVLIDFYADWCGPCKAMGPVIEKLGKSVQGKARVVKINIDKNQALASQMQIQAVPTFVIMQNGKVVWRHSGMLDQASLMNKLLSYSGS